MRLPLVAIAVLIPSHALADADVDVDVNVDVDVKVRPHVGVGVEAEPPRPAPYAPNDPLGGSHWEFELAVEGGAMGGVDVGDISGNRVGALAVVARQLGPVRVGLELAVGKVWAQRDLYTADGWWDGWEDIAGESTRVGASLRLRGVARPNGAFGPGVTVANITGYVEAGVGSETVTFSGGHPGASRGDVMLGIGTEVAAGTSRFGGADLGVRVFIAESPDPSESTHDVAVMLHLGALFGG